MKANTWTTLASALAIMSVSGAAEAGYNLPGETMGVSLDSPLPEGIFFVNLESYGRADNQLGAANVGLNLPVILWSTPFSFYNTRLEFLAALPFLHVDGAVNDVFPTTMGFGPILGHDFGNGLTGGVSAFVRTPDPDYYARNFIVGRTITEGDFRESLQYSSQGPGIFGGLTFIENAGVTTALGQKYGPTAGGIGAPVQNDQIHGDFTIEKTFDKLTIGFTGFGNHDIDDRNLLGEQASVELGGLVGYDFGRFSLTGIVTRTVYVNQVNVSDTVSQGHETRGWVRLIVPLYVAPAAPVVTARY